MRKSHAIIVILMIVFAGDTQEKHVRVTLDRYFNNEWRKTVEGKVERFHYIWEETDQDGYSIFGKIFADQGAILSSLETAPTKSNLKNSDIYIIVDPDNLKDNKNPNYIEPLHIKAIRDWVNQGGVLVLMGNDSVNCDLIHLNQLANNFGINFSNKSRNMVQGNDFSAGTVILTCENEIFKKAKKTYLKEISVLEVKQPARSIISMGNDVIMAVSTYGKGTVFAVGDPWLYNEYVDGKKIPSEYENFRAGNELAEWLIKQTTR